jgi:hypothetical protein
MDQQVAYKSAFVCMHGPADAIVCLLGTLRYGAHTYVHSNLLLVLHPPTHLRTGFPNLLGNVVVCHPVPRQTLCVCVCVCAFAVSCCTTCAQGVILALHRAAVLCCCTRHN